MAITTLSQLSETPDNLTLCTYTSMHIILVKNAATTLKHFIRKCYPVMLQPDTLADMLDVCPT
jgi:hypothetical protein